MRLLPSPTRGPLRSSFCCLGLASQFLCTGPALLLLKTGCLRQRTVALRGLDAVHLVVYMLAGLAPGCHVTPGPLSASARPPISLLLFFLVFIFQPGSLGQHKPLTGQTVLKPPWPQRSLPFTSGYVCVAGRLLS